MRFGFFLLAVLGAGGAMYLFALVDAEADKEHRVAMLRATMAENGIRRMLWSSDEYDFSDLVIGATDASGDVVFRGMVAQDGGMSLVYGRAQAICDADFDDPDCWTIAALEIDGRAVALSGADE